MVFCVWLLSLSRRFSRFTHVVVCIRTSLLFMGEYHSITWICHLLLMRSSTDGPLDYFHLLAIVSGAATNIQVQVPEYLCSVLLGLYLGVELLGMWSFCV